MTDVAISNDRLRAVLSTEGAELRSLRPEAGEELIWQAGPAWPRHAPVLFPFVGRLNGDRYTFEDRAYAMRQHGFARDREFALESSERDRCRFTLTDDEASREAYPFRFRLGIAYALEESTLTATYEIENTGDGPLFCSIGAHPAFRWPLAAGIAKEAHRLVFDADENGPTRRLDDGLLRHEPIESLTGGGRVLPLDPALFADDAIVMQRVGSRHVLYEATEGEAPKLRIGWRDFDRLGLWSRHDGATTADFLCIEPWSGNADPVGFEGPLQNKPGILRVAPGDRIERSLWIEVVAG